MGINYYAAYLFQAVKKSDGQKQRRKKRQIGVSPPHPAAAGKTPHQVKKQGDEKR